MRQLLFAAFLLLVVLVMDGIVAAVMLTDKALSPVGQEVKHVISNQ